MADTTVDAAGDAVVTALEPEVLPPAPDDRGTATASPARPRLDAMAALFTVTAFVASGLLFSVQPIVTRMLMPELGGSPAAWNTAMVFFQAALLLGYVAAHHGIRRLGVRRHTVLQVGLLGAALVTLPVALPGGWAAPTDGGTEAWTLLALTAMVGAPFAVLATSSPTLQRWLAATDHPSASDPYFLYAAGNAGSLLALVTYPLAVDRALGVRSQADVWAGGFVALLALFALCAVLTRRRLAPIGAAPRPSAAPVRWHNPRWIAWAAVPSALLLGTTRHLATDVASIPLLWVVPLCLYLATFIAAFGRHAEGSLRVGATATRLLAVPAALAWVGGTRLGSGPLLLHLGALTAISLLAHARLAVDRPPARDLTGFYVALSVGGVLGGAMAALVAPLVFDRILEYPIALAAGLALLPRSSGTRPLDALSRELGVGALVVGVLAALTVGIPLAAVIVATGVMTAVVASRLPRPVAVAAAAVVLIVTYAGGGTVLRSERTFFGVSRVERSDDGTRNLLVSGSTIHGSQVVAPARDPRPSTYYVEEGSVGQVLTEVGRRGAMHVGVVGLGAGELAHYAGPDDAMTFYEIDPAVVRIATDPELFTYVPAADGAVSIELGDGRLLVEQRRGQHDVLIVDAFSSDAIPMHLVTKEAMAGYVASLRPHGVVMFHVTNQYFDLVPIVAALGEEAGFEARVGRHGAVVWVALAAPGDLPEVTDGPGWSTPEPGPLWTDDHADLLGALDL